jgi:hypothetical protein
MKRKKWLALIVCILLLAAASASAQTARISLFSGATIDDCNLADWGSKLHEIYVVYTGSGEFTATEFRIEPGENCSLTYVGETIIHEWSATIGRADTGIAVAVGECMTQSPVHVMKVYYYGKGLSGQCSELKILPDPRSPHQNGDKIFYVDCHSTGQWADPGHLLVNSDDVCTCTPGDTSPVANTTWGGVKALYVD